MDSFLFGIGILSLIILLLIFLLKKLQQPYMTAYMLAGVLLGPGMAGVFVSPSGIEAMGEVGILLLMFFLGMEIEIPDNKSLLLTPIVVQTIRSIVGLAVAFLVGKIAGWPLTVRLLVTVLFTFNSTAVVSEFLKTRRELHSLTGKTVLNTLLFQDILLAPALIVFKIAAHQQLNPAKMLTAIGVAVTIFLLLRAVRNSNMYQLPLIREMEQDHDLQVFTGAAVCLGFALLANVAGLAAPIGSFAAGILIGRTHAFHWLGKVLQPFKVFFTALFFVSVGIGLDVSYLSNQYLFIGSAALAMLLFNTIVSALVLRLRGFTAKESLYAGAMLSQTDEFGIITCTFLYSLELINTQVLKAGISFSALSLLLSPLWMNIADGCFTNSLFTKK